MFKCLLAIITLLGPIVAQEAAVYRFGVYASDKPSVVHAKFAPTKMALEAALRPILGSEVRIELRIYPSYDSALIAIILGKVDFSRVGPASYVYLKNKLPKLSLMGVEQKKGKLQFNGVIVVRDNSPIKSLSDLKGRTFAFGDRNSTIGRYLAQAELIDAGIDMRSLTNFRFLGRHDKVFKVVEYGDFEAGALKESTFKKLNKKSKRPLRVLHSFSNVTKPWIAHPNLSPKLTSALTNALLGLTDPKALKSMKVDRIVKADDSHFAPVRKAMKRSEAWAAVPVR